MPQNVNLFRTLYRLLTVSELIDELKRFDLHAKVYISVEGNSLPCGAAVFTTPNEVILEPLIVDTGRRSG